MNDLTKKVCLPCEGGVEKLLFDNAFELQSNTPMWSILVDKLVRDFVFDDFAQALYFVNHVGKIAEEEGHHPDITFGWGYVKIELTTHAIDGLSENDFIVAAKIDQILGEQNGSKC